MAQTQRAPQKKLSALRQEIVELSQKLRRAMHPTLSKEWAQLELTMPQLKAVLILDNLGAMAMSRLATLLGVATPTTTGIVDRLEERGLVARESDPSDRRVVNCVLSHEGHELVNRFWEQGQWEIRNLVSALSVKDLEVVADALQILCRAAQDSPHGQGVPSDTALRES